MESLINNIKNNLETNKVNIVIKSNEFLESIASQNPKTPTILDPISIVRNIKKTYHNTPKPSTHPQAIYPITKQSLSEWEDIIYNVLVYLDTSVSLLPDPTNKIKDFYNNIIKTFPIKSKELKVPKSKVNISNLENKDPTTLLYYISRLINKNIIVKHTLYKVPNNKEDAFDLHTKEQIPLKDYFATKIQDLESKLVKDIKELAEQMDIETTKLKENKKTPLTKKELIEAIKAYHL